MLWKSLTIHAKGLNFLILYEDRCLPLKKEMYHSALFFIAAFVLFLAQLTKALFFCVYKIATYTV